MICAVGALLFSFLLCDCVQYCYARDTLTTGHRMTDSNGEALVSAGNKFQLGFFAPNENSNKGRRYIGIWYYNITPQTIVWVFNRDAPILDGSGIFAVDEKDGDLKLLNSTGLIFSTRLNNSSGSHSSSSTRTVKLLDNGNLVLIDDQTRNRLWQSFDNPTDTFLPEMIMNKNLSLSAWISSDDPAEGDFAFRQDDYDEGGYVITKKSTTHWKSGGESSGGKHFIVNPNNMSQFAALLLSNNSNYNLSNVKAGKNFSNWRLVMHSSGEIQKLSWGRRWVLEWSEPREPCSVYNTCGDFSMCDNSDKLKCKCLRGLELKPNNLSSGCSRKSDLCSSNQQDINATTFFNVNVKNVAPPTTQPFDAKNETECRSECLKDCRCQAYYYRNRNDSKMDTPDNKNWCWTWKEDLTDFHGGYADGGDGYNLSIKITSSDYEQVRNPGPVQSGGMQPKKKKSRPSIVVIIPTSLIVAVILFCSSSYFCYSRLMTNRKDQSTQQQNPVLHLYDGERRVKNLIDQDDQFREDDKKDIDVPFFQLESILAATHNFSQANKLGQGGFGPVYKGKFPGGEEIAVKRLSSNSIQGLKEFKNEVVLIAKLQHRNLVRLLGYCVEGNEKILLYEYMPNKSLDAFIFDEKLRMLLDWKRRFDIILGVARGLVYLHQDSRLRIIHRDMKASNILLDEEMNPKISDFGLARIVGGRETEANTNRVVGTYGYMSPEYALDGQFSVKSDVFSSGVVVLEIICGKRNTGFYESELNCNLLGYAWNLWKEEKPLALLDETLVESCNEREVLKCIIIGLLCVQEDPGDRPTMSKVLFMLNSDMEMLQNPKQPVFISTKRLSGTTPSSSTKPETFSENEITMSMDDGR